MTKRVAIIGGGGASGLVSIRQLVLAKFDVVAFEKSDKIGGIWAYNENPKIGPMYRDMKTNIPRQVMEYPYFPFTDKYEQNSFVHHSSVLKYLEDYAQHYELKKYIRFNTEVKLIRPIFISNEHGSLPNRLVIPKWEVTSTFYGPGSKEVVTVQEFDYVIVCNGHHDKPRYPDLSPNSYSNFNGQVIHSKEYRSSNSYTGSKVIVIGYGPSGIDISVEIAAFAKEVILLIRNKKRGSYLIHKETLLPTNIKKVYGSIETVTSNGLILNQFHPENTVEEEEEEDQILIEVDAIVLCTGFEYSYPFLSEDCKIEIQQNGTLITPLYRHLIHMKYPSMCFIGITVRVIPFILFYCQIEYYIKCIQNGFENIQQVELESETSNSTIITSNGPQKQLINHILGPEQFNYNKQLIKDGNFIDSIELNKKLDFILKLSEVYDLRRQKLPTLYKNDQITIVKHAYEGNGGLFVGYDFNYIENTQE